MVVPGQTTPVPHPVRWRYRGDDEINALLAQGAAALCRSVVADFTGISDRNGDPLAFSSENLETLCNVPYWRRSVVDSYIKAVAGLPDLNSETPPADGAGGGDGEFEVLPENGPVLAAFLAAQTQWRVDGWSGRLLSLDFASARAGAEGIGLEWPKVARGVMAMERAVLEDQAAERRADE